MLLRTIALFLLIPAIAFADKPALPTLKTSVVLPMLRNLKITDNDSPQAVLQQLTKILGDGMGDAGGPSTHFHSQFCWELDDHTQVSMFEVNGKLVSVDAKIPGKGVESFYSKP